MVSELWFTFSLHSQISMAETPLQADLAKKVRSFLSPKHPV